MRHEAAVLFGYEVELVGGSEPLFFQATNEGEKVVGEGGRVVDLGFEHGAEGAQHGAVTLTEESH